MDRQTLGHRLGYVATVAGGENDPRDSKRLEIAEQSFRSRTQPIGED